MLFALPIVGSQSLGLWFAKPMAFHLLEDKVTEIKAAMAERHRELDAAINQQLAQFEFNCGAKDMALLRDPHFYSTHIRLQGLVLASGHSCSSLGVEIPLLKALQNSGQTFGKLGITATVAKYNTEQEVVAFYRSGGNL
ncbi:MAG: EAL domain-containing protein, partial [Aeromonas veronii]